MLLSTHILSDIELICERLALLHKGHICFIGSVPELAEAVEGKVYILRVPEVQAKEVTEKYDVISVTYHKGTAHLRVLVSNAVPEGAEPANPTSEDGYIYMLKQNGGRIHAHSFAGPVGVQDTAS